MIPSRTPTMSQLFDLFWQNRVLSIFKARPGRIESYDASGPKANVKLLDKIPVGSKVLECPVLPNVPVVFPTFADGGLTFPINEGDLGLVLFCDALLDKWKSSDGTKAIDPGDDELVHDLNNAVFVPGMWPFGKGPTVDASDLVLRFGDAELRLADDGTTTLQADADTVLTMATTGEALLETKSGAKIEISATGQITVTAPSPLPIIIDADLVQIAGGIIGQGVARIGDSVAGGVITSGSTKVLCG